MIIGLDIDNVISDFDGCMEGVFVQEDKNKRNTGVLNAKLHYMRGMLDWSEDEVNEFMSRECENYAKRLKLKRLAKHYIDRLIEEGHTVVLITHRREPYFKEGEKTTREWLKLKKINYHKLVLSATPDKTPECVENNIDIMFDDRAGYVYKMRERGVNCILVLTKFNQQERKNLSHVSGWKQLYGFIKEYEAKQ